MRIVLKLIGVRVRMEGLENIPAGTCIFAANHVSNIDPLAFVPNIPRRVSVALKKELFRMPILSYGMKLSKFIVVDRASRQAAADSLRQSIQYLNDGLSFAIYPEGTRSPDGRLLPFKRGAFLMAIQTGVPIVPVSIAGAQKLMRKGELAIHPGEVVVRFQPPVDTSSYSVATLRDLVARVHAEVAAGFLPISARWKKTPQPPRPLPHKYLAPSQPKHPAIASRRIQTCLSNPDSSPSSAVPTPANPRW